MVPRRGLPLCGGDVLQKLVKFFAVLFKHRFLAVCHLSRLARGGVVQVDVEGGTVLLLIGERVEQGAALARVVVLRGARQNPHPARARPVCLDPIHPHQHRARWATQHDLHVHLRCPPLAPCQLLPEGVQVLQDHALVLGYVQRILKPHLGDLLPDKLAQRFRCGR